MSFRKQQLSSLIRNEAAKAIQREVDFPEGVLTSITGVSVTADMSKAMIMVSVIPSEKKEKALKALNSKRGAIQTILFKKINIMSMPKISFEYDPGPEKAAAIEKITLENHETEGFNSE